MLIFIKLLFFFGGLVSVGWFLSRFLFRENKKEVLIPLSLILGISFYLFFLNLLAYFIPIQIAFYLVQALCYFVPVIVFLSHFFGWVKIDYLPPILPILDVRWRRIVFGLALLIFILAGLVSARALAVDELVLSRLPTVATIAAGNFPILEVQNPNNFFIYHYAPELFAASLYAMTDLPIWFGYDLQIALLAALIFLLGFFLIRNFCRDNFKAVLGALIMVYGGSLNFLSGLSASSQDILGNNFSFVAKMIHGQLTGPVVETINHHWPAFSFALIILIFYFYFRALEEKNWGKIALANGVLLGFLALTAEVYFGVLYLVFLIYPLFFIFKDNFKRVLKISWLIILIALPIALFQGGVLTEYFKIILSSQKSAESIVSDARPMMPILSDNFTEIKYASPGHQTLKIYDWPFISDFGLPLILFAPAGLYFWKRREYLREIGLFSLTALVSFLIPVFITLSRNDWEMRRFFYLPMLFWGLILGLFLSSLWLAINRRWIKYLLVILFLGSITGGLLFQSVHAILPLDKMDKEGMGRPLGALPQPSKLEQGVYNWVKQNTTVNDYFITFERNEEMPDVPNYRFIIFTGRLAPIYKYSHPDPNDVYPETPLYQRLIRDCSADAVQALDFSYIYVNNDWPVGLEEECLAHNKLSLAYHNEVAGEFSRIYKIIK